MGGQDVFSVSLCPEKRESAERKLGASYLLTSHVGRETGNGTRYTLWVNVYAKPDGSLLFDEGYDIAWKNAGVERHRELRTEDDPQAPVDVLFSPFLRGNSEASPTLQKARARVTAERAKAINSPEVHNTPTEFLSENEAFMAGFNFKTGKSAYAGEQFANGRHPVGDEFPRFVGEKPEDWRRAFAAGFETAKRMTDAGG